MTHNHSKWFYLFIVSACAVALAILTLAFVWLNTREMSEPKFGVTFSWTYAKQLGHDPVVMYTSLLDELGVRHVRLPVYWSDVERTKGEYDWSLVDRLVALSQERSVELTLVVGMKVPRWPECWIPDWAEAYSPDSLHTATLAFIKTTVERYREFSSITRWQVENEPFFAFGQCPDISTAQYIERVDLVRQLDDRPIQLTVSGEFDPWAGSAPEADVLGVSLYRQTWNDLFGYFVYPLTPEYYFFRAQLVKDTVDKVIVSELQAEPWFPESIESRSMIDWYKAFPVEQFEENIAFARRAGLSEIYLWGAEWWYTLKQAGDDRLWESAKELFIDD